MKVALVHDWLTGMRGGEKCLEALCEMFPDAILFTLVHVKGSVSSVIEKMEIKTSFIQKFPFVKKKYRSYLPLYPLAIEQFDVRNFDLIISSSHCVAKGIIPHPNALHVCYCHTPMRYVWAMYEEYFGKEKLGLFSKHIIPPIAHYLRIWDIISNGRVDHFISNSENVKNRIWRYYRRKAEVIYPPVDTEHTFLSDTDQGYFLMVTALAPYKRVDLAIQAFNRLKEKLIIVGTGPEEKRLKAMANTNIEFVGWIGEEDLEAYYRDCRALIFPGEEDFGIVPIEAQCYGKPVIAYGKGGVLETVKGLWLSEADWNRKKEAAGLFFHEQTVEQLILSVQQFQAIEFDPKTIRNFALQFNKNTFKKRIKTVIERHLSER